MFESDAKKSDAASKAERDYSIENQYLTLDIDLSYFLAIPHK